MLAAELRAQIDALWDKFWAGGLANPLVAIDQINYLIFLRRLEEQDDLEAMRRRAQGADFQSIFEGADRCRWSYWRHLKAEEMFDHVQSVVFPWLKNVAPDNHAFTAYMKDAVFLIPKASLLVEAVKVLDELQITEQNIDTQGDIFEYMLSKLSVAGQIGQFRTPRHIIRALTAIADPRLGEPVVDPACGTGGFLIAAAQHMIAKGTSPELLEYDEAGTPQNLVGDRLSDAEWAWLRAEAVIGFDFDPSMVRIAAMNMVLHGIPEPHVEYADVLGPRFPHVERAQVVLANPPFSGSIDPADISDEFRVGTKKTELLFLQLFLDLLAQGGRAVVIVPEGVLMGGDRASRAVRRQLLDKNTLLGVVALPHSTFKPYASVSTAALVFRRGGSTKRVWMYRVEADGFSQNAARSPINDNDLPDLLEQWGQREEAHYAPARGKHGWVDRQAIAARDDELAPRVYLHVSRVAHSYPTVRLSEICVLRKGTTPATKAEPGPYPFITTAEKWATSARCTFSGEAIVVPLVSSTGHGHASIKRISYVNGDFDAATIVAVLQVIDDSLMVPRFLYYYLRAYKEELLVSLMKGAANVSLSLAKIGTVEVPLLPVEEQLALIAELDSLEERRVALLEDLASLGQASEGALTQFKDRFSEPDAEAP